MFELKWCTQFSISFGVQDWAVHACFYWLILLNFCFLFSGSVRLLNTADFSCPMSKQLKCFILRSCLKYNLLWLSLSSACFSIWGNSENQSKTFWFSEIILLFSILCSKSFCSSKIFECMRIPECDSSSVNKVFLLKIFLFLSFLIQVFGVWTEVFN